MSRMRLNPIDLAALAGWCCIGVLGLIGLFAPDAVAFSSYLVLPFLILFPAPTLLVYATLFAVPYLAAARRNRWIGAGFGLTVVLSFGFLLPPLVNKEIAAEERGAKRLDRQVPQPLVARGIIGVVRTHTDGKRESADVPCDKLCLTLLYSGA